MFIFLERLIIWERRPKGGGPDGGRPGVFFKKLDVKLEKGLLGVRAVALMSFFSKWYAADLVGLLDEEKQSTEWKELLVGEMLWQHFWRR